MKYRIKKSQHMNLPATTYTPTMFHIRLFPIDTDWIFFFYIFLNRPFQPTMGKMKNSKSLDQSLSQQNSEFLNLGYFTEKYKSS